MSKNIKSILWALVVWGGFLALFLTSSWKVQNENKTWEEKYYELKVERDYLKKTSEGLLKNWKEYTQKQESKLYKYGVLYLGTTLMMISPFIIDSIYGKLGMIIGLILITIQTQKTKQYNLSLLNAVGIVGYLYALLKNIL